MGRNSYDPSGAYKLCTGPMHREGVMLPLARFYTQRNGKPVSQCRVCRNFYKGAPADAGLIDWDLARPTFQRLVELLGSKKAVSKALGLPPAALSRKSQGLRLQTFDKARRLLAELDQARRNIGEAEVVNPEPLGEILRRWIVNWLKAHPAGDDNTVGPLQKLHFLTVEHGHEINIRRISGISNSEFPYVSLSQADTLLTCIDKGYLLATGEIGVLANPHWSMERWIAYMAERGCI